MANEFIGRSVDFGVAVEAVRGTAESTADRTVRKVECNIIPRAERVIDDTTFGRLEDAERVRTVRKWSEGDLSGIVHADVIGYFFNNLYGSVSTSPSGSGYVHSFTLDQTILHPTLTMFVKDASVRQEKIAGGVVSQLELTAVTDNYVRFNATFLGKEGVSDASSLPALSSEYDFVSRDIVVKTAGTEAGLSSATALKVKDMTITWNPNAEADWVFGSYSPDNIYNKQFSIEGTFTRNFTDETFKDLYEGSSFVYMSVTITGEAVISVGVNPKLSLLLNKVQVTDWNRTSAGDELSTETITFKAFYNTTDAQQSELELTNKTAVYSIGS
jgi:hypothetical protein